MKLPEYCVGTAAASDRVRPTRSGAAPGIRRDNAVFLQRSFTRNAASPDAFHPKYRVEEERAKNQDPCKRSDTMR
jgi:hypothetical protein